MTETIIVTAITEIANARMKNEYPLLDKHFGEYEVKIVCEAYEDLSRKIVTGGEQVSLHLPPLREGTGEKSAGVLLDVQEHSVGLPGM